jgi:exopolyphosphatase/guanosine-5'-triphosphate,3'-diphosphate pyrophosphatase
MSAMPIDLPAADAPLAAVDIGSNSFRLEIGQMLGGGYRRIDYLKESVRLGAGLDGNGRLGDEASERGLACLRRFAQRLQGMAPAQVRAVATQTLREARNRNEFLQRASAAIGHPIEVISGREEARLIYSGVAHLQPGPLPRLVIDIGGRSTEMILGRGPTPTRAESFAVGCVSLSLQHFPEGRLSAAAFRAAQVAAGAELEEALEPFAPQHWREALGSSGTAGAVSQVLAANNIDKGLITPEGLRWLIERCLQAGHIDRLELPGLKDDRRPVLAGGLALLYTLAAQFGIRALQPARGALRQGVIIDLHERHAALRAPGRAARGGAASGDIRDATVHNLQRRFSVDTAQAARVRRVAMALYDGVARTDKVSDSADGSIHSESDRELGWACDLHELGMMVSHHDHHRHSAYLLGHVDAAGFSQSQQWRLAAMVLGQRGGLRKIEAELKERAFALQVLALRLAVVKCHARGRVDGRALRLENGPHGMQLRFTPEWAATHPRTLYLLQQEAQAWARSGVLELALEAPANEAAESAAAAPP